MLYLVPTPIGNLEDITLRAIRILKECDLILAEDTRTSKKLLQHLEIETRLQSFHAHNEHKKLEEVLLMLEEGREIALISDAGTPGISDPGFLLVRACRQKELPLTCLPGAAALVCAVVMSGLPCEKFHYEGFLPQKKGRLTRLKYISQLDVSSVVYVSPHKILKTIKALIELCGPERPAAVVREISKIYEETIPGNLSDIAEILEKRDAIKGEYVLVLGPNEG